MTCKICGRELGDVNVDEHHWLPKTFGGRLKEPLHRICHRKIHSIFTERELANYYNTPERILENQEIQQFVKWVAKKSADFYSGSKDSNDRRNKRRR